jgi:hypothetical protein
MIAAAAAAGRWAKFVIVNLPKSLPVFVFMGLWLMGCSSSAPVASRAPTTVMIAIRMVGGGTPSTQQTALVHKAIGPALAKAGLELAPTLSSADYLVTVTVTPDPSDPTKAHMAVTGVEQNQRKPGDALADARARLSELERWGESRSAPIYGP